MDAKQMGSTQEKSLESNIRKTKQYKTKKQLGRS